MTCYVNQYIFRGLFIILQNTVSDYLGLFLALLRLIVCMVIV